MFRTIKEKQGRYDYSHVSGRLDTSTSRDKNWTLSHPSKTGKPLGQRTKWSRGLHLSLDLALKESEWDTSSPPPQCLCSFFPGLAATLSRLCPHGYKVAANSHWDYSLPTSHGGWVEEPLLFWKCSKPLFTPC